ncbi:mannose-1-phosphate guanylyltransferase, putative [Eimeria necatrix]|uniref:Mannose-1-phosphate guanylyltransferase, putative n=1 Tax=Eimeria necatrix TaxID=51315 RepID=U6MTZ4_9EIME|nr:mannose-1-phosphate guanylyltransferase, putative [Eimeria necatrix]CDJ67687.1 mannose-1-phosphate guanylyltransferase, putative [Eimeria necatrix]
MSLYLEDLRASRNARRDPGGPQGGPQGGPLEGGPLWGGPLGAPPEGGPLKGLLEGETPDGASFSEAPPGAPQGAPSGAPQGAPSGAPQGAPEGPLRGPLDVGNPGAPKEGIWGGPRGLACMRSQELSLVEGPQFIGNVLVDPSAVVGPDSVLGPNVTVAADVQIGRGCRLKNCALLPGVKVGDFSWINSAILGWHSQVGKWVRVEGLSVVGEDVRLQDEVFVNGAFILPHKTIANSIHQQGTIIMGPQGGPRGPQGGPRGPQGGPRGPQGAPGGPLVGPHRGPLVGPQGAPLWGPRGAPLWGLTGGTG